jgi:uncharacterized protein YqeY
MSEVELRDALKTSMKARDSVRTTVLRNVLSGVKNKVIETRAELSEADITAIIKREAKQVRETLDFAVKAGRDESAAEHEKVLSVLEELLPQQMDEDALRQAIAAIISETGASALGGVMKELGQRHAGTYDGKTASRLAGEALKS